MFKVNYRYPKGYRLLGVGEVTKAWKQAYVGIVRTPRVVASDPG
jgi:hypothetical protein